VDQETLNEIFETHPELKPVARFAQLIPKTLWFRHIGDPLDDALVADCRGYAQGLGFPDAEPAVVVLWEEAKGVLESTDVNPPAWEEEEQLRAGLVAAACETVEEAKLTFVLDYVAGVAVQAAQSGAEDMRRFLNIGDESFLRLATGTGAQICHQAALVLVGNGGAEHPFSLKYRLFEHGRWPLGIIGSSLNIF